MAFGASVVFLEQENAACNSFLEAVPCATVLPGSEDTVWDAEFSLSRLLDSSLEPPR